MEKVVFVVHISTQTIVYTSTNKCPEIDSEIMEGLIRLISRRVVVHCKTVIMCDAPSQLEKFRYRKLCRKDISRFTTL